MEERLKLQKGFTLLEVLLSIVILFIIFTSFMVFFNQSAVFTQKNDQKLNSIQIAQEIIVLLEENVTKQGLLAKGIIDSSGSVIGGKRILTESEIESYTNQPINPSYDATAELTSANAEKLIQIKLTVQHPTDSGSIAETFTYVRR